MEGLTVRRGLAVAAVLAAALVASGCTALGGPAANPFGDEQYVSTAGTRDGDPVDWLGSDPLTMTFSTRSGHLEASVGTPCNSLQVPVSITGDRFTPDGTNSTATLIGCERIASQREDEAAAFFGRAMTYTLTSGTLVLKAGGDRIEFRLDTPVPSASAGASDGPNVRLTAGHTFTSTGGRIGGISAPWLGGSEPFQVSVFTHGDEEYLGGTVGCNSFAGGVVIGSDSITRGRQGVATSQVGCRAPLPAHEEFAIDLLGSELAYRYDGTTLVLTSATASVAFVRSDADLEGHDYESTSGLPADFGTARLSVSVGTDGPGNLRITARIACATLEVPAIVRGDVLVKRPGGGFMDAPSCPPQVGSPDSWMVGFSASNPTIAVDGDELTLTSASDSVTFRRIS